MSRPTDPGVKSADRVLDILELLASTGRDMSHADIARRTGVPKSSLTQLLRTLAARGYVAYDASTQAFRLGDSTHALSRRGARVREIVDLLQGELERLTRETGESSALSLLRDHFAERIASARSSQAVLYAMHAGVRAPLYASSAGKVLLASLPPHERDDYLRSATLRPLTERTVTSAPLLRKQLERVREEDVAYSLGEFVPGIVGVAVPVRDVHRRVLAAVGIALPAARFDAAHEQRLIEALRRSARTMGEHIGALQQVR